jgi:polyhydroxyalkanoate synthase
MSWGYCLGGVLALLAAAGNPDVPVQSLVVLATPLDFSALTPLRTMFGEGRLEPEDVLDDTGNVPAASLRDVFALMQSTIKLITAANIWASLVNDESSAAHQALIGWSNQHVPFPRQMFGEMVRLMLRQGCLMEGRMPVGGRIVDLHTISCPVLSVVGDRDKLVPPEGTAPLETALKGVDLQTLHLSAGHAGLFVGRSARKHGVPAIVAWLAERD